MSAAIITPLRDGSAVWSLNGVEHHFDDVWSALAECRRRRLRAEVQRFPSPSVEVIAVSPVTAAT